MPDTCDEFWVDALTWAAMFKIVPKLLGSLLWSYALSLINLSNFEKFGPVFVRDMTICIVYASYFEGDIVLCMTNFKLEVSLEPTLHRTHIYVVKHSTHGFSTLISTSTEKYLDVLF